MRLGLRFSLNSTDALSVEKADGEIQEGVIAVGNLLEVFDSELFQ